MKYEELKESILNESKLEIAVVIGMFALVLAGAVHGVKVANKLHKEAMERVSQFVKDNAKKKKNMKYNIDVVSLFTTQYIFTNEDMLKYADKNKKELYLYLIENIDEMLRAAIAKTRLQTTTNGMEKIDTNYYKIKQEALAIIKRRDLKFIGNYITSNNTVYYLFIGKKGEIYELTHLTSTPEGTWEQFVLQEAVNFDMYI